MNKKPKPTIITFSGKARHGKDTALEVLKNQLEQAGKNVITTGYADALKDTAIREHGWNGEKDEAGRSLLQNLGSQKREEDPDFWVNKVIEQVKDLETYLNEENAPLDYVLIRDARYPNEMERWKEEGYNLRSLHIERTNFESDLTPEQLNHPSETALDGFYFSNNIKNTSIEGIGRAVELYAKSLLESEQKLNDRQANTPKPKTRFEEFGEWVETAKQQSILGYLLSTGHKLKRDGNYYYKSEEIKGLNIGTDGWAYFNDGSLNTQKPIEFVKRLLMMQGYGEKEAYKQAVMNLSGQSGIYEADRNPTPRPIQTSTEPKDPLVIKDKDMPNEHNDTIIEYLRSRGIDSGIIEDCIKKGKIYQTGGEKNADGKRVGWGNVAFVSRDKNGEEKHISIRSTYQNPDPTKKPFRMDVKNSDKKYPFILEGKPDSKEVYVFESPIDALSHATIVKINGLEANFKDAHRIAVHGISLGALRTFLADNPDIKTIIPCFDKDPSIINEFGKEVGLQGQRAAEKLKKEFEEKGYEVAAHRTPTVGKDWNDMLLNCEKYGLPSLKKEAEFSMEEEQGYQDYDAEAG